MGLDAIVYRNAANFSAIGDDYPFEVDQATGEIFSEGALSVPADRLVATRQRLGNMDEVRFLRKEVQKQFGDAESILIQKVLYSATHSGDAIVVSDMALLRKELDVLRASNNVQLHSFIAAMNALIEASEGERNPIVFA